RRYALFTLVGIAGEDDLDAPDLTTPTSQTSGPEKSTGERNRRLNGSQQNPAQRPDVRRDRKVHWNSAEPMLGPEASAELRDRLLAELADLACGDDAAIWAHRSLRAKNGLTAADAQRVEESFQARLASFAKTSAEAPEEPVKTEKAAEDPDAKRPKKKRSKLIGKTIDKSVLALPELRRVRDRDHVRYVAKQVCLVCGRHPSDAHHLRFAQSRALARKVSDEFTVPLCRGHHREVHRYSDEAAWWRNVGVDPISMACALWLETHPLAKGPDTLSANVGATATISPTDRASERTVRHGDAQPDRDQPPQCAYEHEGAFPYLIRTTYHTMINR